MSEYVKVDTRGLELYRDTIRRDLVSPSGGGPIRGVFKQWAARWRSFQKLRFVIKSRGGGGWKPLADSTVKRRRNKSGGSVTILWDKLGSITKALTPSFSRAPGQYEKDIPCGITVGFGGPGKHPSGRATIADIASFHDAGTPTIPARTILDDVDSITKTGMRNDLEDACVKLAAKTNIAR